MSPKTTDSTNQVLQIDENQSSVTLTGISAGTTVYAENVGWGESGIAEAPIQWNPKEQLLKSVWQTFDFNAFEASALEMLVLTAGTKNNEEKLQHLQQLLQIINNQLTHQEYLHGCAQFKASSHPKGTEDPPF